MDFVDVLRGSGVGHGAALRHLARVGRRGRCLNRQFVPVLRERLGPLPRHRWLDGRGDARNVRDRQSRLGRRRLVGDRSRALLEGDDRTTLDVFGCALLRRIEDQADEKHCKQHVQRDRGQRTARKPLSIVAVARIAFELHNRLSSAFRKGCFNCAQRIAGACLYFRASLSLPWNRSCKNGRRSSRPSAPLRANRR